MRRITMPQKKNLWCGIGCLVSIALLAPTGAAHPSAQSFDGLNGRRCYYYDDHDTNTRQIWLENNGILSGGEAEFQEWFGLPPLDGQPGSGLQREPGPGADGLLGTVDDVPPDILLDTVEATTFCTI